MDNFTPYSALAGGFLIGLSAALLMLFNGRIAGISGIAGTLLSPGYAAPSWRLCFLAGLLLGPWLLTRFGWFSLAIEVNASVAVLAVAGLLTGYGASLGGGCTSGHGICGLARLSPRSLAATLTFMTTAGITVYIVRHVIGAGS